MTTRAALVLALMAAAGCAKDRTMLVVEVQSNMSVPAALDEVRVVVTRAGAEIQRLPYSLVSGSYHLPLRVGLLSPSGGAAEVSVSVVGVRAGNPVVTVTATTTFVEGRSLLLEMFLAAECAGFDCGDPTKTCVAGRQCVAIRRPSITLPDFHPGATDAGTEAATEAGTGEAGGGGSDGGDGASCTPTGPESCFNGRDDDCNGKIDCADPACTSGAVCVPAPAAANGGTYVTGGPCPAGFNDATRSLDLTNGFTGGGTSCSGCRCANGTISCSATLSEYTDLASCAAGGGTSVVATYQMSTDDPNVCPIPYTGTTQVRGASLSPWTVRSGACAPSGNPQRTELVAGPMIRFCAVETTGTAAGCAAGQICIPKPTGRACVLLADGSACPGGTSVAPATDVLYTGLTDTRACGPCTCGAPQGSCDGLTVEVGSDYTCDVDYASLRGGTTNCFPNQPNGIYVPGFFLAGAATPPTCAASSTVTGAATPTGPHRICCLP